jgi:hypothetical protein
MRFRAQTAMRLRLRLRLLLILRFAVRTLSTFFSNVYFFVVVVVWLRR